MSASGDHGMQRRRAKDLAALQPIIRLRPPPGPMNKVDVTQVMAPDLAVRRIRLARPSASR